MKYIILFIILFFVFVYLYSNFYINIKLPSHLNKYTIFGPVFKNDKENYHTQFRENIFYCVNSFGKIVKKGKYKFKMLSNGNAQIHFYRKKKKYQLEFKYISHKKNVFIIRKTKTSKNINSKKKNILLVNTDNNFTVKNLNNKTIIYTIIDSHNNFQYPKYSEFIHFYKQNTYNEMNITLKKKKYSYIVSSYENGFINEIDNKLITKLIFYQNNSGKFTTYSSNNNEILYEGKFKIIN